MEEIKSHVTSRKLKLKMYRTVILPVPDLIRWT